MFLTGTFPRSLDEKLRIALPKSIRQALGEQLDCPLFLAPGTDGSLAIYTEDAFSRIAGRLAEVPPNTKAARDYARLFFARATSVKLDGQGRIRIPLELAEITRLNGEVVLIGVRDHLELWNKSRWDQYLADRGDRYDELAERAFG